MIENEVLKALQCCRNADCEKCPCLTCELNPDEIDCYDALINAANKLVKSNRTKIEQLTEENAKLKWSLQRANKYGMELEREHAAITAFAKRIIDEVDRGTICTTSDIVDITADYLAELLEGKEMSEEI